MQTRCTSTRDSPIASPAKLPAPFLGCVVPSTTNTKIAVNTISAMSPPVIETPGWQAFAPVPAICVPLAVVSAKRIAEPSIAPITWNTIYIVASLPLMRPVSRHPSVIAGLM